ncbi:glycosyl transferase family group 2-domain-containing protein [Dipodascopsis tothii]|uniref:glycosyl transferase family group 2-domain-containing protein n=1 Tax=Dipodascopsis tothii TaxID=44089 RepID=UPI0034CE8596
MAGQVVSRWTAYGARVTPGVSTVAVMMLTSSYVRARHAAGDAETVSGGAQALVVLFALTAAATHACVVGFTLRAIYALTAVYQGVLALALQTAAARGRRPAEDEPSEVVHVVVVPNYGETLHTLRQTLAVLAGHGRARAAYDIVLAMEAAEGGADGKAALLEAEFAGAFRRLSHTIHAVAAGETPGKSANMAWAASQIAADAAYAQARVVVTVIDADTHLLPSYFDYISRHRATHGHRTLYIPPVVFDRNSNAVSPLVRCADLLWSSATIAGLYRTSTIKTPTSAYSLPLELVRDVGGWDTDDGAVGEDLHMFLKCYFATAGRLDTVTVFSPASHCNVEPAEPALPALPGSPLREHLDAWLRQTLLSNKARYTQACRHTWGMLDAGYTLRGAAALVAAAREPLDLEKDAEKAGDRRPLPTWSLVVLLHRIYEAHFLPIHYLIYVVACSLFPFPEDHSPLGPVLSAVVGALMGMLSVLRTAAFFGVVVQFFCYERYHRLALVLRRRQVYDALAAARAATAGRPVDDPARRAAHRLESGLHDEAFAERSLRTNLLDYVLFPIAGAVFGAIPTMRAQALQFWTTSLVYEVSAKP